MAIEQNQSNLVEVYKEKAIATGCQIHEFKTFDEAIPHLIKLIQEKPMCELLYEEDVEKGPLSPNEVPTRTERIVACPELGEYYDAFKKACDEANIKCIKDGLRKHLAGIDMGIALAYKGIAQTGTCMVNTNKEDTRLATMIGEFCVLVLKKSEIMPALVSMADIVREFMGNNPTNYVTFMSGPSRTADIERVGATGVHGCLEMHIVLLEG